MNNTSVIINFILGAVSFLPITTWGQSTITLKIEKEDLRKPIACDIYAKYTSPPYDTFLNRTFFEASTDCNKINRYDIHPVSERTYSGTYIWCNHYPKTFILLKKHTNPESKAEDMNSNFQMMGK